MTDAEVERAPLRMPSDWRVVRDAIEAAYSAMGEARPDNIPDRDWQLAGLVIAANHEALRRTCAECLKKINFGAEIVCLDCKCALHVECAPRHFWPNGRPPKDLADRARKQTKKRKTPVKIGTRLLAHLARWKRMDEALRRQATDDAGQTVNTHMHVVWWGGGRRIKEVRNGWRVVLKRVGMERAFTPHHMRHTRATWMMQENVPMFEAAGSLGMSIHTLENVYAHHRPDWQKRASEV